MEGTNLSFCLTLFSFVIWSSGNKEAMSWVHGKELGTWIISVEFWELAGLWLGYQVFLDF